MKILNVTLLTSLFVFAFIADAFCQLTSLPDNPSENDTKTVSEILNGLQEAAESYNQTLQNLQVTQTITFKSTVLGEAKITKQIRFQRPDIIEEKVLQQEKKEQGGVQMNINDSVSCALFIEPLVSSLSLENYNIRLIGKEAMNGHPAYVLRIKPKNNQEYSIKGDLWIDAEDLLPVKYEGKPLEKMDDKSSKGKQVIEYEKIDDTYWLPVLYRWEARWVLLIKMVNETTFRGYKLNIESN
jgi:outer membrane lipoprotein-sorting protein